MILTNLGKVDSTSGHGNRMVLWQTAEHGLLGVYTYTTLIFSYSPFNFNLNCRASKEYNSCKRHKIIPNGYNIGRDWLVKRAVEGSRWKGMRWKAEVEWRTDLIESGEKGQLIFFHFLSANFSKQQQPTSLEVNHGIPQDGRIAILTVLRQ
jgi:hypothetical protein